MLSALAIEKAKPSEKPQMLSDGLGLHLLITPEGSKLWRFRYRYAGKQRMLSFGSFPDVGLADARQKRDDARKLVAAGIDPSQKRKDDKRAAAVSAANTFQALAAEYLERLKAQNAAETTVEKNRWLLEDLAKPLAHKAITAITSADVLDLLRTVEKTGRRETARRLRGVIGSVFRFAITTLRAENVASVTPPGTPLTSLRTRRANRTASRSTTRPSSFSGRPSPSKQRPDCMRSWPNNRGRGRS